MEEYSANEESGVIRCICKLTHDDGFTIQCDSCFVWQHTVCVQVYEHSVPERYYCEECDPRELDAERAHAIQLKKLGLKKSKAGKMKRQTDRVRKDSISGTRTSSNAPSPTYLANRIKKKSSKRSTINSPNVFSPKEIENDETTNNESLSYDSPEAEHLVNEICQNLHKFKNQLSRRSWEATSTFPPDSLPFPYTLTSNSFERDNDYKSVSIMDKEFLEQARAEIEISRATPKGAGKRIIEGLFVRSDVPKDQFVFEIIGKVVLKSAFSQDMDNIYPVLGTVPPEITFHSHLNLAIDCRYQHGPSNILRRSCTPNAEVRSFFVAGVDTNVVHLGVFAITDLKDGDEVLVPWTISSGVFPDGLPTDINDLSAFRKSISSAYALVHERYAQNLSPDQALSISNALKREICSCQKEPLCHINLLFKYRKAFWSRHKLGSLAALESSLNSPKSKPIKDESFTNDLQTVSKNSFPKSAISDVFDNESIASKPLSGSETEMDSSTQSNVKVPEESNKDFENEYSPINSTLDILDDISVADVPPPSSKTVNDIPNGEIMKDEERSSPLEIESNYCSQVEETPSNTQFDNYADRIGILSTMSLTKFFINKWKYENQNWHDDNKGPGSTNDFSLSNSPRNDAIVPNSDFLRPISAFPEHNGNFPRSRVPPSPTRRSSQPNKKKKSASGSHQFSKKKVNTQTPLSDLENPSSSNYKDFMDFSPTRNSNLSPTKSKLPNSKSDFSLEDKSSAKNKRLDKIKSKMINKGAQLKKPGESKNTKTKSMKIGSSNTPSLTTKLPGMPRRRPRLSWADFAIDHSSKLDDPNYGEEDVAPEDILNASQRPSLLRLQERQLHRTNSKNGEDSDINDIESNAVAKQDRPRPNLSRSTTPIKQKIAIDEKIKLSEKPVPTSDHSLNQIVDNKDSKNIFVDVSLSQNSPKVSPPVPTSNAPDSQPQSPDFSLINPTAVIQNESSIPLSNKVSISHNKSPPKAPSPSKHESLPPSPKPTQQTIYSIKQPQKIPPDANAKPEMYETELSERLKFENNNPERVQLTGSSKDPIPPKISKLSSPFSPNNFEPPEEGEIKPGVLYDRSQNESRSISPIRDYEYDRDRTGNNRYHSQYPSRYNEDRPRDPSALKRFTSFANSYRPGHKPYYEPKSTPGISDRLRYGPNSNYDYDRRGPPRSGSRDYSRDLRDIPRKHDVMRGGRRYSKPSHYRDDRFADRLDRGGPGPYSRDYRYPPKFNQDREDDMNGDRPPSPYESPTYSGHRTPANEEEPGTYMARSNSNPRYRIRVGSPNHGAFSITSEPSTSNHHNEPNIYRASSTHSTQRNDMDTLGGRATDMDLPPQSAPSSTKLHPPSPPKELSS